MMLRSRTLFTLKTTMVESISLWQRTAFNLFHTHSADFQKKLEKQLVMRHPFQNVKDKQKKTFLEIVKMYRKKYLSDRGCADFITVAVTYMDEFGVNKDIECYKALIDMLPRDKYIARNVFQTITMHYPVQQYAVIDLLSHMEKNFVMPDPEVQQKLLEVFGTRALVMQKLWRMTYWMGKFQYLNPWKPPNPLPTDPLALSKFAMWKISTADVQSEITEYRTKDVENATEDTWILSVMSKTQEKLLELHDSEKPLYIEGPFNVWVAAQSVDYFVLRSDPIKRKVLEIDLEDISQVVIPFWEEENLGMPVTIYEQEEGVYISMCATGTSSKDSLLSWIRCLEKAYPKLKETPIVFKLKSTTDKTELIEPEEGEAQGKSATQMLEKN